MSRSVNPDIHETNKLIVVAKELMNCEWLGLEWSLLYGATISSVTKFQQLVSSEFSCMPVALLRETCPKFVDYMIEDCSMDVHQVDWMSLATAIDNSNGMYHPLRLTKIVMGEKDE